jgi:hypothetical protein
VLQSLVVSMTYAPLSVCDARLILAIEQQQTAVRLTRP